MTTDTTKTNRPGDDDTQPQAGDELSRERYRELLEELRTILPGVQVLFAFLLTAPFSARFTELDEFGRDLYAVALIGSALSMIVFLAPTSYHRIARRAREDRLRTAISLVLTGMVTLAISVLVVIFVVLRFIFDAGLGASVVIALGATLVGAWYVLPLVRGATR
jgi:cation transport ATPase